ncbi:hypothetical protein JOD54_004889 [Actinokineospora baliensis]|uniref:hypothetical protein n=1 Tax=Actinokineospora baliensis TaxID=547056 RepID=UPI00195E96B3|nr:hypothetical protein [Actinokineospora baliensis]MBM7774685.1 hypothetical protein [Actinokineospora baliensis]
MHTTSKRMLVLFGALTLALSLTLTANAKAPSARPAPTNDISLIRNYATQNPKCVGLANNGSTANGTRLVLWDCHHGLDQQWSKS